MENTDMIGRKRVCLPPARVCQKETAPIMHLSSPTDGLSAKAITVSIQWWLMVHNKPRTSNLSWVIVKIILFFFLPEQPISPETQLWLRK